MRVRDLPEGIDCTRSVVRHRLTGSTFELKRSLYKTGTEASGERAFDHERKVLQRIAKLDHVTKLIDLFDYESASYMIISLESAKSIDSLLRQHQISWTNQHLDLLQFACSVLNQASQILA